MKILIIDDEKIALESAYEVVTHVEPEANIDCFRSAEKLLEHMQHDADYEIAFLDIEMRGMDGITLAKRMKKIQPKINIIFTTGYSEYAGDAFSLHASGYLMKPITVEKVKQELDELRFPVEKKMDCKMQVITFGKFDVKADGKSMKFKYSKTLEILAYLVDQKGAFCSNGEIVSVLWETDDNIIKHISYLQNLRHDLLSTLKQYGCEEVVEKQRGALRVVKEWMQCDYYDYLDGKPDGINAYQGEYMSQYSWSEVTHASFDF